MEPPAGKDAPAITPRKAFWKGVEAGWLLGGGMVVLCFAAILQFFDALTSPLPWILGGAALLLGLFQLGIVEKLPK